MDNFISVTYPDTEAYDVTVANFGKGSPQIPPSEILNMYHRDVLKRTQTPRACCPSIMKHTAPFFRQATSDEVTKFKRQEYRSGRGGYLRYFSEKDCIGKRGRCKAVRPEDTPFYFCFACQAYICDDCAEDYQEYMQKELGVPGEAIPQKVQSKTDATPQEAESKTDDLAAAVTAVTAPKLIDRLASVPTVAPVAARETPGEEDSKQNESGAKPAVKPLCVVCQDRAPTHACIPCGHKCVCDGKADMKCPASVREAGKCPICRQAVIAVIEIFG